MKALINMKITVNDKDHAVPGKQFNSIKQKYEQNIYSEMTFKYLKVKKLALKSLI